MFERMPAVEQWIKEAAANSLQPSQVENSLRQLSEKWPNRAPSLREVIEQFPLGPKPLIHLLAVSRICAARLQRNSDILLMLAHQDASLARSWVSLTPYA